MTDVRSERTSSFALEQCFSLTWTEPGGYEVSVCPQKNEAAWKGCSQMLERWGGGESE